MQPENPFWQAVEKRFKKDFRFYSGRELLIVIPDESVLEDLYAFFGVKSFSQMFPNGEKDVEMALGKMMFVENIPFPTTETEIDGIRILTIEYFTHPLDMKIFYIEGFLQDAKLEKHLNNTIFHGQNIKADFSKLPDNVLQHMIEAGEILGRDLTALCLVNRKLEKFCKNHNYEIFRVRLAKEFGVNYYESPYKNMYNPRELYLMYHTNFFRVYDFGEHARHRFGVQYVYEGEGAGSSGRRIVSESWTSQGLFDIVLAEAINPNDRNPRHSRPLYIIFDSKNPNESASIFDGNPEQFYFDSSGNHNRLMKYLKIDGETLVNKIKEEFRGYERELPGFDGNPRLGGKFTINGVELDFIDVEMYSAY